MSYTKTAWNNGDVITAEKLNNLEGGVERLALSNIYAVPGSYNDGDTLDEEIMSDIWSAAGIGLPICIMITVDGQEYPYLFIGLPYYGIRCVSDPTIILTINDNGLLTIDN